MVKLVLIQGNFIAHYEGRKQGPVVKTEDWEWDAAAWVEFFRQHGVKALGTA